VLTGSHTKALAMLESLGVVIITGEPGIGKTTLAEHLALHYATEGFQFIALSDEIREAEAVFSKDKKQLFYFDDFLGRNYLQALSGHEGSLIVHFIRRIQKDPDKRFILTSRSTILNQGKVLIDQFTHQNIDKNEFELRVSSLKDIDKAKILYSHIWHSALPPEYVEELYKLKRYRTVIEHDNFNPRLISFITDAGRLEARPVESYWNYVCETLGNPADVWENPLSAQQDDYGRAMVLLVALNGRPMAEQDIAEAYSRFTIRSENSAMSGRRDYISNLRQLTGSLLSRRLVEDIKEAYISLFNPSIGDFVLRRYARDLPALRSGFHCLRSLSSLETLTDLKENGFIETDACYSVLRGILAEAIESEYTGYDVDYMSLVLWELRKSSRFSSGERDVAEAALKFILSEEVPAGFLTTAKIVHWGMEQGLVTDDMAANFLLEACDNNPSFDEIKTLADIQNELIAHGDRHPEAAQRFREAALEYMEANVTEEVEDADVFDGVDYEDIDTAESNAEQLIRNKLEDLGINPSFHEVTNIVGAYDLKDRRKEFHRAVRSVPGSREPQFVDNRSDEIDDLFDRS
jgi:adenylate kinase family enzyme